MVNSSNEVKLLTTPSFEDSRGRFRKIFHTLPPLENYHIKQVNYVENKSAGIIRGLHYQKGQYAEAKVFRILTGAIQVVCVDLEEVSKTYKRSFSVILEDASKALYIPRGYATGYAVLRDNSSVIYFSDNIYMPEMEAGIRWNDPMVDVEWKIQGPELSEKDAKWPNFDED